jgi:hypothetical protein
MRQGASLPRRLKGDEHIDRAIMQKLYTRREQLLALPENREGLRLDLVEKWRERRDWPVRPILFLDKEEFVTAKDLCNEYSHNEDGGYVSGAQVAIMRRDPELEALNGSGIIESLAVHELAHASSTHDLLRVETSITKRFMCRPKMSGDYGTARIGHRVKRKQGYTDMLEEAQAEYERGKFVVETLGRPMDLFLEIVR